jgi:hypothetical protein
MQSFGVLAISRFRNSGESGALRQIKWSLSRDLDGLELVHLHGMSEGTREVRACC